MGKINIDSHSSHKFDQYGKYFVSELENMVNENLGKDYEKPHVNNCIIFSVGITKRGVDDETSIPTREPENAVKINMRKFMYSQVWINQ